MVILGLDGIQEVMNICLMKHLMKFILNMQLMEQKQLLLQRPGQLPGLAESVGEPGIGELLSGAHRAAHAASRFAGQNRKGKQPHPAGEGYCP